MENEIARRGGLGLKRYGAELIGPCPRCGGTDRFAVSIHKQVFVCRGCGAAGDVIALTQHVDRCDFRTAVRTLDGFDGRVQPGDPGRDPDQNKARALKIWHDAAPIASSVAEVYLNSRGLQDLPGDDVLRFLKRCPYDGTRQDCLLALFRDIHTNEPRAIHRTALDANGNKLGRLSLGPVKGSAIKLDDDTDVELGLTIGEGLETVLAARQLGFKPAWALGSAGAIRNFPVLGGIEALTILVDHDAPDQRGRQAGQEAAAECARRWLAAGKEVQRIIPRRPDSDMADVLTGGRNG